MSSENNFASDGPNSTDINNNSLEGTDNFNFYPDRASIPKNAPETEFLCPRQILETDSMCPFHESERDQFKVASYVSSTSTNQVDIPGNTNTESERQEAEMRSNQSQITLPNADAPQIEEIDQNQVQLVPRSSSNFDSGVTNEAVCILPEDIAVNQLDLPEGCTGSTVEFILPEDFTTVNESTMTEPEVERGCLFLPKCECEIEQNLADDGNGGESEVAASTENGSSSKLGLPEDGSGRMSASVLTKNGRTSSGAVEEQMLPKHDDSDYVMEQIYANFVKDGGLSQVAKTHLQYNSERPFLSFLNEQKEIADLRRSNLQDNQLLLEDNNGIEPEVTESLIKVDLTDLPSTPEESDSEFVRPRPRLYEMVYYPFWFRPDGQCSLLATADNLVAEKCFTPGGHRFNQSSVFDSIKLFCQNATGFQFYESQVKPYYCIELPIRNISVRPITFQVKTCDNTKYEVKPMIGILERGQKVEIEITTRSPGEWSYVDLQHDSVQILASTFTTVGDLCFGDEDEKFVKQIEAAAKFWQSHGTHDFPYAEQHVVRHMLPHDMAYLDEPSLNQNSYERFHERHLVNLSFLSGDSNNFTTSPEIKPRLYPDMEILFGDFSQDPGDLFVRDQIRALALNRKRLRQFSRGYQQSVTNLTIVTVLSFLVCLNLWIYCKGLPIPEQVVAALTREPEPEPEPEISYWLSFLNFWPFSIFL